MDTTKAIHRVGVVIPTWNGRELLRACLLALRAQTFRDFQTYVVDNGSRDGTVEMLEREFHEARLIHFHHNHGFGFAANAGLRAAAEPLIALLNNDVTPEPQWLEALVKHATAHPDEDQWASVLLWAARPDRVESAGLALGRDGAPVIPWRDQPVTALPPEPVEVMGPCGGAALYRWRLLQEVGLFDENFFCYAEDLDLTLRARLFGFRCMLVPSARGLHQHMGTARRKLARTAYLQYRNLVLCLFRNMRLGFVVWRLPRFVFSGVLPLLFTPWRSTGWALMAAKIGILWNLPHALGARRHIRHAMRITDAQMEAQLVRRPWPPIEGIRH